MCLMRVKVDFRGRKSRDFIDFWIADPSRSMAEYHWNQLKVYLSCTLTDGFGVCYSKYDSLSIGWAMVIVIVIYWYVFSLI